MHSRFLQYEQTLVLRYNIYLMVNTQNPIARHIITTIHTVPFMLVDNQTKSAATIFGWSKYLIGI